MCIRDSMTLISILGRENTVEAQREVQEEMASMKSFDTFFDHFSFKFPNGQSMFDANNINFDCLRATIDTYESRCQKFTDYGMTYMTRFAEACHHYPTESLLNEIQC